jgi:hypothetical protein
MQGDRKVPLHLLDVYYNGSSYSECAPTGLNSNIYSFYLVAEDINHFSVEDISNKVKDGFFADAKGLYDHPV